MRGCARARVCKGALTAEHRCSVFPLVPCERGDPVEPGQLVRVADGVDAGDPTVLDGEAHRGVDLTADVDPAAG